MRTERVSCCVRFRPIAAACRFSQYYRMSRCTPSSPVSLDDLLDVLGALVVVLDTDGRLVRFNRACEELTGYREANVVGKPIWDVLVAESDAETVSAVFDELRKSGRPNSHTNDWITKDGERRRITWSNTVSTGDQGHVHYVIGTGIDITDRLAVESALRRNRALLQSMIATSPDAIITIDHLARIESFNTAAESMFGYAAGDVIGKNVHVLMPEPYRSEHDGYMHRYQETGEKRIIGIGREVIGLRKDGTTFPIELAVAEVELGDQRRFTGFIRDITKRREAEDQLRNSLQRIQEIQTEFTHISRLSAMGEMAATLAHELNQPLTAMMNYVQAGRRVLKSDRPDAREKIEDVLSKASAQAHRAGEIIRRLRSFVARGETEKMPDAINEVVTEACDLALVGAQTDGIVITTQLEEALPSVMIDRVQIQQVVVNLLRNSIDALEGQSDAAIRVTTRQDRGIVRVSVADNGPGLDKEIAEKLFQSFNTSKPNGMGIGLSISRSIVEDHGGRIDVAPCPDAGVEFWFTLPLVD